VLLPILGPNINIQKKYKKQINEKKLEKIYKWKEHEECPKNCQNMVEEDQNIQSWKLDGSILTDKGPIYKTINLGRKKNQNWVFNNSIVIIQGLIEFITALIARKICFWIQYGL